MVVICNSKYTNTYYDEHFAKYGFPLSDFQKYAIEGIVKGQHVLVTAHTGSGKTLPAEFAIDHLVAQGKKVIYTSPIKALSNQKFYDFTQKFPHIQFGLFTGDIKTNPEADVLIMTTEILMNTLFNQTETNESKTLQFQMDFQNELGAVVFDEIHYINDADRGQVWEKTILMLPPHIQMVMLSATIDDPKRFAEWCEQKEGSTKQVYLSSTNHRVVPLTHYTYLAVSDSNLKMIKDKQLQQYIRKTCNKIQCIQSEKGKFHENVHQDLVRIRDILDKQRVFTKRKYVLNDLARYLKNQDMLPAIGFVFSRKQVEQCAREMTTNLLEEDSKIPYAVQRECDHIIRRLPNHEEYRQLPEYIELVSLLEKGIGIHHSGMIPILREIVELCISKKYIKLLFATESFAIGLDCPIKTAMFLSLTKFDGNHERDLHSHEYTQMAGRAGRRGIDTIGHVVHCNNLFKPPPMSIYKGIMCGKPPSLVSKYRISYDMILNVLRTHPEATIDTLIGFTNKSMMFEEVNKEIRAQGRVVAQGAHTQFSGIRTPEEVCKEYHELQEKEKTLVNKKKKECLRRIAAMKEEHSHLQTDYGLWKEQESKKQTQIKNEEYLAHLQDYIANKTRKVCTALYKADLVTETMTLSDMGVVASHINEVDSVVWTKAMMKQFYYFHFFSVKQIVGLFSCATDVKVHQDFRKEGPSCEDAFLQEKLGILRGLYDEFEKLEYNEQFESGIQFANPLMYDIIDEAMEWCDCNSEEACKQFIQTKLVTKEISLGDFTKAMMKIATIAREFQSLGDLEMCRGNTEMLNKMSQIEDLVLKYIATNQSLYV